MRYRTNRIRIVLLLGVLSTIGIIGFQSYWVVNTWNINEVEFNQKVNVALLNVAQSLATINNSELPAEILLNAALPIIMLSILKMKLMPITSNTIFKKNLKPKPSILTLSTPYMTVVRIIWFMVIIAATVLMKKKGKNPKLCQSIVSLRITLV